MSHEYWNVGNRQPALLAPKRRQRTRRPSTPRYRRDMATVPAVVLATAGYDHKIRFWEASTRV